MKSCNSLFLRKQNVLALPESWKIVWQIQPKDFVKQQAASTIASRNGCRYIALKSREKK